MAMKLDIIKTRTTWNDASTSINRNNLKVSAEITKLQNATYKNKGYFRDFLDLTTAYPTATMGSQAYVGTAYPYTVYNWTGSSWTTTGATGGDESVELGYYYTKEETEAVVEDYHEVLTQEEYDALETYEDKLYFCYEE